MKPCGTCIHYAICVFLRDLVKMGGKGETKFRVKHHGAHTVYHCGHYQDRRQTERRKNVGGEE